MKDILGKQVTAFGITWMAMTKVARGTVVEQTDKHIIIQLPRPPRKRKTAYQEFELGDSTLVFEGDAPFKADTESNGTMHGNACLNFVGNIEDVKSFVETKNLNEKFNRPDCIMMVKPDGGFNSFFTPVFLDTSTCSAPVERYREEMEERKAMAA